MQPLSGSTRKLEGQFKLMEEKTSTFTLPPNGLERKNTSVGQQCNEYCFFRSQKIFKITPNYIGNTKTLVNYS